MAELSDEKEQGKERGTVREAQTDSGKTYLACERRGIYFLLMMSAGMMGAYTFSVRGGVFCNAQTANVVMMAVALGNGNIRGGLYFLIPISAYCFGAFVSEALPSPVKARGLFRWDTCLIAFEMAVLFAIGFIPFSLPDQIVQVSINFIASMQYNTFRQAEGTPMATTFCTNHVRQIGIALAKIVRKRDFTVLPRATTHFKMLLSFLGGGFFLTFLCIPFPQHAIWLCLAPLSVVLCRLAYADLTVERDRFPQKPGGH